MLGKRKHVRTRLPGIDRVRFEGALTVAKPTPQQRVVLDAARKALMQAWDTENDNGMTAAYLTLYKTLQELSLTPERTKGQRAYDTKLRNRRKRGLNGHFMAKEL